jgi:hypothetical protein
MWRFVDEKRRCCDLSFDLGVEANEHSKRLFEFVYVQLGLLRVIPQSDQAECLRCPGHISAQGTPGLQIYESSFMEAIFWEHIRPHSVLRATDHNRRWQSF